MPEHVDTSLRLFSQEYFLKIGLVFELPTSPTQLRILHCIALHQQANGGKLTGLLKRSQLCHELGISENTLRALIRRLCASGHLIRIGYKLGRADSGTVYRLPATTYGQMTYLGCYKPSSHQSEKKIKPSVQGISFDSTVAEQLADIVKRLNIEAWNIGANDLQRVWRKVRDQKKSQRKQLDNFLLSIEHIIFYMKTPESKTIKNPRAWMIATLHQGFYAEPAHFKSILCQANKTVANPTQYDYRMAL